MLLNGGNTHITSMSLLCVTIASNLLFHYDPNILTTIVKRFTITSNNANRLLDLLPFWHSHKYSSNISSLMVSMFSHANWEHVLSKMITLYIVGRKVFNIDYDSTTTPLIIGGRIQKRSNSNSDRNNNGVTSNFNNRENGYIDDDRYYYYKHWTNPLSFLWLYFGSQICVVLCGRLLSYKMDMEWDDKVISQRKKYSFFPWMNPMVDLHTNVSNLGQLSRMKWWQYGPTIGASGAVYGIIGAHLYTSCFMQNKNRHPGYIDLYTLSIQLMRLYYEFSSTPFSIDDLITITDDNIDHIAHLSGFLGGVLLAGLYDFIGCQIRKRQIKRQRRNNSRTR